MRRSKLRKVLRLSVLVLLSESLFAQTKNAQNLNHSKTVFEGQPVSIRLAPHVTTTIRLPEAVNSVVLGDSNRFRVFAQRAIAGICEADGVGHRGN